MWERERDLDRVGGGRHSRVSESEILRFKIALERASTSASAATSGARTRLISIFSFRLPVVARRLCLSWTERGNLPPNEAMQRATSSKSMLCCNSKHNHKNSS